MTLEPCKGHNKDGSPCSANAQTGKAFCPWHDPERAEERDEWRRKGGRSSSKRARAQKAVGDLRELGTVQATMIGVLKKLENGEIEPAIAVAMATVARSIDALAKTNAASTMEQQLVDMARQIAEINERRNAQ